MARRETPWHIVLVTDDDGKVLCHTVCNTPGAAHAAEAASKVMDPWWWANYEIKPMTPSELAYLILG